MERQMSSLVGDERRFKQVLVNLIKNAVKFTKSQGNIDIRLAYNSSTEMLLCQVCDDGVGISRSDIPSLFNRFGKLHRTA